MKDGFFTYCLAFLGGLGAMAWVHSERPNSDQVEKTPEAEPRASELASDLPTPKATAADHLAVLAGKAMDGGEWHRLHTTLCEDWAREDPLGLLDYLQDRPWPSSTFDLPFVELARTNPEALVRLVRQEGCYDALSEIGAVNHRMKGDPKAILDALLAQPNGSLPPDAFQRLFNAGTRLDPNFFHGIHRISDPTAKMAAYKGATQTLLNLNRRDEFAAWYSKLNDLPIEPAMEYLSLAMIWSRQPVTFLNELPDKARQTAQEQLLPNLMGEQSVDYQRVFLSAYVEQGWVVDHMQRARNVISSSHYTDSSLEEAEAWRDWSQALPPDAELDPLRNAAIQRWIGVVPDQWQEVANLERTDLRDVAYTTLLATMDLKKNAEIIPEILRQLSSPALIEKGEAILKQRRENKENPGIRLHPYTLDD